MASVSFDHRQIVVALTRSEKLVSLRGDVCVSLSTVRDVHVSPDPLRAARGMRAPGLGLPGRAKIGTWRGRGWRQFLVARRGVPAVRLLLAGAQFDEIVVSVPDAERIADELRQNLASVGVQSGRAHAQPR